jgi:hypothetical protein
MAIHDMYALLSWQAVFVVLAEVTAPFLREEWVPHSWHTNIMIMGGVVWSVREDKWQE